jgi:hypothetical protein
LDMIEDHLSLSTKIFRAGKHSANAVTFKVLDKLEFKIDCSMHPPYQLVGWKPFKIGNTSVWEIPTYSDVSPEIYSPVDMLFRLSSLTKSIFNGIYVGLIHPMIFGNNELDTDLLLDKYRLMIEKMIDYGYEFATIEDAFNLAWKKRSLCNIIGKTITMGSYPIYKLIRKKGLNSVLNQ